MSVGFTHVMFNDEIIFHVDINYINRHVIVCNLFSLTEENKLQINELIIYNSLGSFYNISNVLKVLLPSIVKNISVSPKENNKIVYNFDENIKCTIYGDISFKILSWPPDYSNTLTKIFDRHVGEVPKYWSSRMG